MISSDRLQAMDVFDAGSEKEKEESCFRLGILFLLNNTLSLIFLVVPVLAELPSIPSKGADWYGVEDIMRLLEPIIHLPLILLIFAHKGNLHSPLLILFGISAAIYQQGSGFHSAANMFKHSVEALAKDAAVVAQYPAIRDVYSWMRDDWEHLIAHYMAAVGGIFLSWVFAYLYRDLTIEDGFKLRKNKAVWGAASISYALLIIGIAVQFIYGSFVALGLILVYGYGVLGYFSFRKRDRFVIGRRPVIQYYLLSYSISY